MSTTTDAAPARSAGAPPVAPRAATEPVAPARHRLLTLLRRGRHVLAVTLVLAAVLIGLLVGPADLSIRSIALEVLSRLPLVDVDSGLSVQQQAILWQIRAPRVVLGVLVGGTLALAGGTYQGVFRNPLADPYLLGVSGGAGLGATVAIVSGGSVGPFGVPALAFVGGVVGVAATFALGSTVAGSRDPVVIVLAGVAVAALFAAVQTFVQQWFDDSLVAVYTWLLGRLSTDGWTGVVAVLPYALVACVITLLHRRTLDVMVLGDEEAASLGIEPARVRLVLVLAATLGTAAAVSASGLIGFVGIVVPHTVRLLFGASHRTLLPMSMAFGAAFLVLMDVVARSALAPAELPIGVVTAAVGAPFFLFLLRRHRHTW